VGLSYFGRGAAESFVGGPDGGEEGGERSALGRKRYLQILREKTHTCNKQ